ncbi:hypothetical protein GCM10017783_19350 [Deinococcus piscis]|uniref:Excalibur calcium-binding domain-containing protein n=1 Tax=Deinococcus piscis TaxID=394230 RepID=A0ABQ3K798_9DEIO|nr:excalibur calcium-binding domain-containing protein [Deinococcus piscis]GHG06918.1 hypothetical protein GCM10017783_19350 [Deinococcus piscis]
MQKTVLMFAALTLAAAPALAAGKIPAGGFKSCKEANAAGYYNIKKGDPAYSAKLDRDGDGMACEKK